MNFLKNFKIKNKLRIPVFLQLILLGVFVYFFFNVQSLLVREEEDRKAISETTRNIGTLSLSSDDYLSGKAKKSHKDLDTLFRDILKTVTVNNVFRDKKKLEEFAGLGNAFKELEGILKENTGIETQVGQLTDVSIKQSEDYIRQVSAKLADRNLRIDVSDLERAVIAGAALNTSANFKVKVLFLQAREDPGVSAKLTSYLDQLIKNAETAEKQLADTPFAQLPKNARQANIKIKALATTFIANLEKLGRLKENIHTVVESMFMYITQIEISNSGRLLGIVKWIFIELFIVISIIALLILVLNTVLTRWIVTSLNAMIERAYDLAVDDVDMTRRLEETGKDELGELSGWFNKFLERLHRLIMKVMKGSGQVYRLTQDIRLGSEELATRTNEQVASITETAATLEQFTAAVRENTENSAEADMMLVEFNSEIQEKSTLIDNVTNTMTEIYDSSKQIDNIIKVINDISFQTNLLALNAAVEAARAGEAGRGFAVVAAEVRNLAQKTAESSKSIQDIVLRNVESTQKGMELVKDTSEFFGEIVGVMGDIVTKISNITNVSREQSTGIEQINQTISQMDLVGTQNAKLVQQLSGTGRDVETNAVELQSLVNQFKVDETSDIKGSDYFTEVVKKGDKKKEKKKEEKKANTSSKETGGSADKKIKTPPTEDDFFGNDEDGFEEL